MLRVRSGEFSRHLCQASSFVRELGARSEASADVSGASTSCRPREKGHGFYTPRHGQSVSSLSHDCNRWSSERPSLEVGTPTWPICAGPASPSRWGRFEFLHLPSTEATGLDSENHCCPRGRGVAPLCAFPVRPSTSGSMWRCGSSCLSNPQRLSLYSP